ncbi:MAG: hypothetical protein QOF88_4530, partial [Mycobacterium sp.]|nr:hypothetical protein [Mycobacterium sp.]
SRNLVSTTVFADFPTNWTSFFDE